MVQAVQEICLSIFRCQGRGQDCKTPETEIANRIWILLDLDIETQTRVGARISFSRLAVLGESRGVNSLGFLLVVDPLLSTAVVQLGRFLQVIHGSTCYILGQTLAIPLLSSQTNNCIFQHFIGSKTFPLKIASVLSLF